MADRPRVRFDEITLDLKIRLDMKSSDELTFGTNAYALAVKKGVGTFHE